MKIPQQIVVAPEGLREKTTKNKEQQYRSLHETFPKSRQNHLYIF